MRNSLEDERQRKVKLDRIFNRSTESSHTSAAASRTPVVFDLDEKLKRFKDKMQRSNHAYQEALDSKIRQTRDLNIKVDKRIRFASLFKSQQEQNSI